MQQSISLIIKHVNQTILIHKPNQNKLTGLSVGFKIGLLVGKGSVGTPVGLLLTVG